MNFYILIKLCGMAYKWISSAIKYHKKAMVYINNL